MANRRTQKTTAVINALMFRSPLSIEDLADRIAPELFDSLTTLEAYLKYMKRQKFINYDMKTKMYALDDAAADYLAANPSGESPLAAADPEAPDAGVCAECGEEITEDIHNCIPGADGDQVEASGSSADQVADEAVEVTLDHVGRTAKQCGDIAAAASVDQLVEPDAAREASRAISECADDIPELVEDSIHSANQVDAGADLEASINDDTDQLVDADAGKYLSMALDPAFGELVNLKTGIRYGSAAIQLTVAGRAALSSISPRIEFPILPTPPPKHIGEAICEFIEHECGATFPELKNYLETAFGVTDAAETLCYVAHLQFKCVLRRDLNPVSFHTGPASIARETQAGNARDTDSGVPHILVTGLGSKRRVFINGAEIPGISRIATSDIKPRGAFAVSLEFSDCRFEVSPDANDY